MSAVTCFWIGNAASVAQVVTLTVTAVATGGVLTVTINGKSISYTCISTDTTTSAAAALQALLAASQFPEFSEVAWTTATNTITATANIAGVPFYSTLWTGGLSISSSAGATMTLAQTTPNGSPSSIANANNWLRNGVNQVPQTGDAIILADSSVPLLWDLNQLAVPSSFTRWQSFTGTVGLPENNPLGYYEYRPTYLSFGSSSSSSSSSGASAPITALLGQGTVGQGPTRERYNFGASQVSWIIRGAGSPEDNYSVRILGTNVLTTLQITAVSVGVGMLPGESASFATAVVDGGGSLDLGTNVTVAGTGQTAIKLYSASADLFCAVPFLSMEQSASATVLSVNGLVYPSITCITGSTLVWNSDGNITTLALQNNSNMDLSGDVRPFTITTLTIDADTCQVNDPNNRVAITNAVLLGQRVLAGPFIFGSGRSIKIT